MFWVAGIALAMNFSPTLAAQPSNSVATPVSETQSDGVPSIAADFKPAYIDLFVDTSLWKDIQSFLSLSEEQLHTASTAYKSYCAKIKSIDDQARKELDPIRDALAQKMREDDVSETPEYLALAQQFHEACSAVLRSSDTALYGLLDEIQPLLSRSQVQRLGQVMPFIRRRIAFRDVDSPAPFRNFDFTRLIDEALGPEGEFADILQLAVDNNVNELSNFQNAITSVVADYQLATDNELIRSYDIMRQSKSYVAGKLVGGPNPDKDAMKQLRTMGERWARQYKITETAYLRVHALLDDLAIPKAKIENLHHEWHDHYFKTLSPSLFDVTTPQLVLDKMHGSKPPFDKNVIKAVEAIYSDFHTKYAQERERAISLGIAVMSKHGATYIVDDETGNRYISSLHTMDELSSKAAEQMCDLLGWNVKLFNKRS